MNGGQSRRFPRTTRAIPDAHPKIEREKIRHRRPNDLKFDEGQEPASRPSLPSEGLAAGYVDDGNVDQDEDLDWTAGRDHGVASSDWDDESEGDWVLDAGRGQAEPSDVDGDVYDDDEEESGVVWDDQPLSDHGFLQRSDEIAFGDKDQREPLGDAPEVELAGRRDVRPKAPRPAPPPGSAAPPETPARRAAPRPRQQQPAREAGPEWDGAVDGEMAGQAPTFRPMEREVGFKPNRRAVHAHSAGEPTDVPAQTGRFSRTRATLGEAAPPLAGSSEQVLQQPRSSPPPRRRQAQPAPTTGRRRAASYRKRPGKGLLAAGLVVVLLGAGWLALQSFGSDGLQSMIDRVVSIIPFPGSARTAADTSFGEQGSPDAVEAEQALSDLEERIRVQQNHGDGEQQGQGGPAPPSIDPAANREDGPPIPKFKPLPGNTRSLTVPASSIERSQLAENSVDSANDQAAQPSLFEQLWRYINPG